MTGVPLSDGKTRSCSPPTRSPYATLVALTRREPSGSFFSVGFDTQGDGGAVITATELATEEAAPPPLALHHRYLERPARGASSAPLRRGERAVQSAPPLRSVGKTLGHASSRPSSSG